MGTSTIIFPGIFSPCVTPYKNQLKKWPWNKWHSTAYDFHQKAFLVPTLTTDCIIRFLPFSLKFIYTLVQPQSRLLHAYLSIIYDDSISKFSIAKKGPPGTKRGIRDWSWTYTIWKVSLRVVYIFNITLHMCRNSACRRECVEPAIVWNWKSDYI